MIGERNQQNSTKPNRSYAAENYASLQPSGTGIQSRTHPHKPSIVFFGNERLATGVTTGAPTLQKLLGSGYDVVAVIANYETGQSRAARQLEIADIAAAHNITLLTPDNPSDIIDQLRSYEARIGILVAYGRIIPASILELFPQGIINIHPSLLPLNRGSTPIEQAILSGTQETGVSLMGLVEEMDAGPVYAQQKISLNGSETKQELADQLLQTGGDLLIEHIPSVLNENARPVTQDHSKATYSTLIDKSDGLIDWHKPALQIEREVRAFAGWPRSRVNLGGYDLIITAAQLTDELGKPGSYRTSKDSLIVFCGEQALEILRLQPAGKKEMPIQAFLSGYKL